MTGPVTEGAWKSVLAEKLLPLFDVVAANVAHVTPNAPLASIPSAKTIAAAVKRLRRFRIVLVPVRGPDALDLVAPEQEDRDDHEHDPAPRAGHPPQQVSEVPQVRHHAADVAVRGDAPRLDRVHGVAL